MWEKNEFDFQMFAFENFAKFIFTEGYLPKTRDGYLAASFFFFFPLLLILLQFPSPVFAVVLSAISSNLLSGIKNKAMMALHSCI